MRRSFARIRLSGRQGFTLIELLLVIGIIAILASIVIIAVNPTRQLGKTRDAQRRADVHTIINAVYQYMIDHGSLPANITTNTGMLCSNVGTCPVGTVDLIVLTKTGGYLVRIPRDPQVPAGSGGTAYYIKKESSTAGRVTVWAPMAEQTNSQAISVTR